MINPYDFDPLSWLLVPSQGWHLSFERNVVPCNLILLPLSGIITFPSYSHVVDRMLKNKTIMQNRFEWLHGKGIDVKNGKLTRSREGASSGRPVSVTAAVGTGRAPYGHDQHCQSGSEPHEEYLALKNRCLQPQGFLQTAVYLGLRLLSEKTTVSPTFTNVAI